MFESYFADVHAPCPPQTSPCDIDDSDRRELEDLGDRIAELTAQIQAATYYLLVMIREFDQREGWAGGGFLSCAHWMNWRSGIGMGTAREKVRVAHALGSLPLISDAMRHGQVSYSKVRAMTRVATPETEGRLLEFAMMASASQVERLVRCWRRVDRIEEAERDARRRESHALSIWTDEDGMLVINGRLQPEVGAVLMRALDAAQDRLYQESRDETAELQAGESVNRRSEEPVERRRADALGLVAEAALAAELDPGTRGDRYLVTLHVEAPVLETAVVDTTVVETPVREPRVPDITDLDTSVLDTPLTETSGESAPLPGEGGGEGIAFLEDGIGVSAGTSRRIACDCTKVTMRRGATGNVLDVGRKTRTISPALRRALAFRDRTCRFPGCGVTVCDGHHVRHWADGGETKLDNLVLLCRRHHMAVHEQGWTVRVDPDAVVRFFDPEGFELLVAPPPAKLAWDSATVLDTLLAAHGVEVDRWTGAATNESMRCDYGLAIDWVRPPDPESATCSAPESDAAAASEADAGLDDDADVVTDDLAQGIDVPEEDDSADWDGGAEGPDWAEGNVPAGTSAAAPPRWSPDPNDVELISLLADFWGEGAAQRATRPAP